MKITMLCGPSGAGKTSYRNKMLEQDSKIVVISGDEQGKAHLEIFKKAISEKAHHILIDRMSFNKQQRERYLKPAKDSGYFSEVIVFHVPRSVCFERIMARENHPTINGIEKLPNHPDLNLPDTFVKSDENKAKQANSALDTFFTKYERVEDSEADKVTRLGWDGPKNDAIICDLDGTLCNIDHRLHHVKHEIKKHNRWDLFNKEIPNDSLNEWCGEIIRKFNNFPVLFCSGRVDSTRQDTEKWLNKHGFPLDYGGNYRQLFMRHRSDFRQDYIIKEIILEFEIKTRYSVLFAIDDRQQVVDLWRRHGIVCLQCAPGDF